MAVEFVKRKTNSTAIVTRLVSGYHTRRIKVKKRIKNRHMAK